ncbi:MAG: peptidase T [Treponema sp.]|jgi:tripeptide aminopeptidase|nr:peptidase T [Treponema sp.]
MSSFIDLTLPRFLQYVRYHTTSDSHVNQTPSTAGQWELACSLAKELKALGVLNTELTDSCYVIAHVPATRGKEQIPTIGLVAHLDTSEEVPGKNVQPIVVEQCDGETITLQNGLFIHKQELAPYSGRSIVHTDGSTLLGADDKAGIAAIMGATEYLLKHPECAHGPFDIIFTPDEETGKSLPNFPRDKTHPAVCYTVDGGQGGELEFECFNAYKTTVKCHGVSAHTGIARGVLVNAITMAATFAAMLPRSESPESTDGRYGYYCPMEINGTLEESMLLVFTRDFESEGTTRRLEALKYFASAVEAQFPGGKVELSHIFQYGNMRKVIDTQPQVVDMLKRAYTRAGVEICLQPIRGGTDGAQLCDWGIPTPNIFTGGRNFHSRTEWLSIDELAAAASVINELIQLWAE